MAQIPLNHFQWTVLRTCLRAHTAGQKWVPGPALRVDMSRRSKTGEFLTEFVSTGLLEANPPDGPGAAFDRHYRLTAAGHAAAEYGYHEVEWSVFLARAAAPKSRPAARRTRRA